MTNIQFSMPVQTDMIETIEEVGTHAKTWDITLREFTTDLDRGGSCNTLILEGVRERLIHFLAAIGHTRSDAQYIVDEYGLELADEEENIATGQSWEPESNAHPDDFEDWQPRSRTYTPILIVSSNHRYLGGGEWGEDMNVVAMPPTRTRRHFVFAAN